MNRNPGILLAASVLLLWSCAVDKSARERTLLLHAVPSDALALAVYDRASDVPADFIGGLSGLDMTELEMPAAVVWGFNGRIQHMLCVSAPGQSGGTLSPGDTLCGIAGLLCDAKAKGLYTMLSNTSAGGRVLVISPSENMISVSRTHLSCGTSIYDAPGFPAGEVSVNGSTVCVRAEAFPRLVGAEKRELPYDRRRIADFLSSAADWYIIRCGEDSGTIKCFSKGGDSYFSEVFRQQPALKSELGLPSECRYAVSLPWSCESRELRERWLDGRTALDKYEAALESLKTDGGVSPLGWEKAVGVKEIAAVILPEGEKLVVIRTEKCAGSLPENFIGFPSVLYGKIFEPDPISVTVVDGNRIICGSEGALGKYLDCPGEMEKPAEGENIRMYVKLSDTRIIFGKDGTRYVTNGISVFE